MGLFAYEIGMLKSYENILLHIITLRKLMEIFFVYKISVAKIIRKYYIVVLYIIPLITS